MRDNIWKGPNGLRAGWRVLIYLALVASFGYATSKIVDALSHGRQYDLSYPAVASVAILLESVVILLAASIMARFEGRSIAEYGLPWRRAFCGQFWLGWAVGFVTLTLQLLFLRLARAYSMGPLQLQGVEILKNAFWWAVLAILAAIVEEFFYRGYLQFTLTSGIGFWPAALVTSGLMGVAHVLNPGWTVLGLITVIGFGLIACFLLRRTGDLWMPLGLHVGWNWGEVYFYGIPCSGQMGHGQLFHGSFHGPAWLTGMPFGVEAGWPEIAVFLIWWFFFAKWLRRVKYPQSAAGQAS
jgi:membrane protease YdiL (CAAX protease family)